MNDIPIEPDNGAVVEIGDEHYERDDTSARLDDPHCWFNMTSASDARTWGQLVDIARETGSDIYEMMLVPGKRIFP